MADCASAREVEEYWHVTVVREARHCAGDKPAVIPPVEPEPWPALEGLILRVGGLRENFVVIDAEDALCWRGRDSADGRGEKSRGHMGHHDKRGQAVKIRKASTNGKPGILELCHSIGNVIGLAPNTLKS